MCRRRFDSSCSGEKLSITNELRFACKLTFHLVADEAAVLIPTVASSRMIYGAPERPTIKRRRNEESR
jgi:hypothetical protein